MLILADEQEDMVDRYLYKGKMYVFDDVGVKCECVVTDEGTGILEIKNIATVPLFQQKGCAKALIEFLVEKYRRQFSKLQVGTGDSTLTMLQIRDILLKSDKLKTSARNNTVKDFEFSYFDDIDDALIEGLEQNKDFFSLLLSNDEIKRQVLGFFTDEIYKSLREV